MPRVHWASGCWTLRCDWDTLSPAGQILARLSPVWPDSGQIPEAAGGGGQEKTAGGISDGSSMGLAKGAPSTARSLNHPTRGRLLGRGDRQLTRQQASDQVALGDAATARQDP